MAGAEHHFQSAAKLLDAKLWPPRPSGAAVVVEHTDQSVSMVTQGIVRGERVGAGQIARELMWRGKSRSLARPVRRSRNVEQHRQRIFERRRGRRAGMRFTDELR
jgi:hypothetical protein